MDRLALLVAVTVELGCAILLSTVFSVIVTCLRLAFGTHLPPVIVFVIELFCAEAGVTFIIFECGRDLIMLCEFIT